MKLLYVLLGSVLWFCCCSTDKENSDRAMEETIMPQISSGMAEITKVAVSGDENAYDFSVTVKSPDTGCDQYADWWEVFDENGQLIYRRILAHSHINEQPFTRLGGPVAVSKDSEVYVRVHMNDTGYSNKIFKGSVAKGFVAGNLDTDFAKELQEVEPLPTGCDF